MRAIFASILCLGLVACAAMKPAAPPPAYLVFFEGHSVTLSDSARAIVAKAANEAEGGAGAMVQIAGPSTKVAPGYDPRYAQPRIDAVTKALIADGVAENRIVQTSLTTGKVKVDTSGAQRVELRVMKPSA